MSGFRSRKSILNAYKQRLVVKLFDATGNYSPPLALRLLDAMLTAS
jgi:hypothetical protein